MWQRPFLWVERATEYIVSRLRRWAFLELLELVGKLSLVWAALAYLSSADERRSDRHHQAWQIIVAARGSRGNGGRIEAVHDLVADNVPLNGVDLHGAFLHELKAPFGNFEGAELEEAIISWADLRHALLREANLRGASLCKADLSDTNLSLADLRSASLARATTTGTQIDLANVYGVVVSDPQVFYRWALDHGAVCIVDNAEWADVRLHQKASRGFQVSDCFGSLQEVTAKPVSSTSDGCRIQ